MSTEGLVTLGETMGLFVQTAERPAANGEPMTFAIGGSESNVAIGMCRLGIPATWIGRVGDDPPGRLIRRELKAEGVEVIAPLDRAPTGLMTRWRPVPGRARVVYHRRDQAGAHLQASDLPAGVIERARVLHGTGITLALGPGPAGALHDAIGRARDAGTTVSLDVNDRRALWSEAEARDAILAVVPSCDVVFAGLGEATLLTGEREPIAAAQALEALGPAQVVVTLGADGCVARIDDADYTAAAPVVPVLDTVGAGDAFVAGYLTELICGADPVERLRTAVRAGALAVTVSGDWEGMPDRDGLAMLDADEPVRR